MTVCDNIWSLSLEDDEDGTVLWVGAQEGQYRFTVDDVDLYRLARQATKRVEERMADSPYYERFISEGLAKR